MADATLREGHGGFCEKFRMNELKQLTCDSSEPCLFQPWETQRKETVLSMPSPLSR